MATLAIPQLSLVVLIGPSGAGPVRHTSSGRYQSRSAVPRAFGSQRRLIADRCG